jgi:hypothetical protein
MRRFIVARFKFVREAWHAEFYFDLRVESFVFMTP